MKPFNFQTRSLTSNGRSLENSLHQHADRGALVQSQRRPAAEHHPAEPRSRCGLYWKSGGGLTFSVTDSSGQTFEASSNLTLADGSWHHVIGVWDGYTLSIYIDGVQAGMAKPVGMGPLDTSTSLLTLGNSTAGVNGFDGSVDEVMLFPRGFTRQEAANLYALGNRVWEAATVTDPSAATSPWTYSLPDGLEGLYEIDLRGWTNGATGRIIPTPGWPGRAKSTCWRRASRSRL